MRARCLLVSVGLAVVVSGALASTAAAQCNDEPEVYVGRFTRNFTGGAAWTFSVARRKCEGLVLYDVVYTPAGGTPRTVLAQANIAELHVPYLDNSSRYLDITLDTDGFGDVSAIPMLVPGECPGQPMTGYMTTLFDGNRICIETADGGLRWKYGTASKQAERVQVFMTMQAAAYTYINRWDLNDDGSINVRIGLTGQLQKQRTAQGFAPRFGSRLNPESESTPVVGLAHQHNVYYRLDFDIGGAGRDEVFKKSFTPSTAASPDSSCSTTGQCGTVTLAPITKEGQQTWSSNNYTTWVISDQTTKNADGRTIGYELVPHITGIWRGVTGDFEKWAGHELWVTAFKPCERLAVVNDPPHIPMECSGNAVDVQQMDNDELVDGSASGHDLVVWYANRILHYPRDEDAPLMPIEWASFDIVPRNFHDQNPSP
jgi:primary-amine oxidase